jgi:hypothetical protein
MYKKRVPKNTHNSDVPYDPHNRKAVLSFWKGSTTHNGVAELSFKRGRSAKPADVRSERAGRRV